MFDWDKIIIDVDDNAVDLTAGEVSLLVGADADTLGAIVGSIAEAIWGIPESMKTEIMAYLPDEMKAVVKEFYKYIK